MLYKTKETISKVKSLKPAYGSVFKSKRFRFLTGFTIIEILVAISILTLFLTITIPNFSNWYSPIKLRGTQRDLISNLRLTQQSTVTTQKNHLIRFNTMGNYYTVIKKDGSEQVIKTVYLPTNISFASITLTPQPLEVEFNSAAVPNSTGDINLIDNRGDTKKVEVTPSGFVKGD